MDFGPMARGSPRVTLLRLCAISVLGYLASVRPTEWAGQPGA